MALAGLAAGLVWASASSGAPIAAAAAPSSAYTVTTGNVTNLTDGTLIPVSVTSSDPVKHPVGWVDIEICRPGVGYDSFRPVDQVRIRGNCGYSPGASALFSPTGSATQDSPGQPSGRSSFPDNFVAGVGYSSLFGNRYSLTCDATNPCDLVVSVFANVDDYNLQRAPGVVQSTTMTFLPFGGIAGCSGVSPDAVQTVGPDRFTQAYTLWSRQACGGSGPGGGKAPTANLFLNEGGVGGAVGTFAQGDADMAFAAGGYDLPGFSEPGGRPYVAVPLALNAVVVAASGGQIVPAYTQKHQIPQTKSIPFSALKLMTSQVASLFGGGYLSASQTRAVRAADPQLDGAGQLVPYLFGTTSNFIYPQVIAPVDATTDFDTAYFTDVAGQYWNSGPNAPAGSPTYVPRGQISAFGQPGSEPLFTSASPYSRRTDLERSALPFSGQGPDPLWVLTDRATATELGFPIVALGNDVRGTYTAPSSATLDAAVPTMTPQPDGTLVPDPRAAQASSSPVYPLTFVEYALAPTEPLVDTSCTPRPASEQLLVQWLKQLTGVGQADLAPGFAPLTSALQRQAVAAIAKIGTAPETGACAPGAPNPVAPVAPTTTSTTTPASAATTTTTTTTVAPAPATSVPAGSIPTSQGGSGTPASPAPSSQAGATPLGEPARSTPSSSAPAAAQAPAQKVLLSMPAFAGRASSGPGLPAVALLLLGLLTGGMALRTAGWSPAILTAAASRLRALGRAVPRRRSRP